VRFIIAGLVCVITCFVTLPGQAQDARVNSIGRSVDPVVLTVKNISAFTNIEISKIGLFKYSAGNFEPIPFQIDEQDEDGAWVLPLGEEANSEDGNGKLDGTDELVFMVRDAGDGAAAGSVPHAAVKALEIEISDPRGGAGYVYLAYFKTSAPRSGADYVSYNPKTKHVKAVMYEMGFHPQFPIGIGYLTASKAAGGDGINRVDRMKVRVEATALLGIEFKRNEEDFTSVDVAYIDGPVRVIRRTRNRMVLILSIPTPSAIIDNVYYRDFFYFPTEVYVPFNIGAVINKASVRITVDLTSKARGITFYNSNNRGPGFVFDGAMSEAENKLNLDPFTWMVQVHNSPGNRAAWLNRLVIEQRVGGFRPKLYYRDDTSVEDAPDDHPGHFGDVGFIIDNLPELESGIYRMVSVMYCVPEYKLGREKKYLDILDKPLKTTISEISFK
jgi:hypothetical protein